MGNDLIVVKQLPVIEEQLRLVKASVAKRVERALSMVCTEDTYKDVKRERAALSKEFKEMEERRKEVKKAILEPYEAFESLYKECIMDVFAKADAELHDKITAVENGIKGEKRDGLIAFYEEYRESLNIPADLVPFDRAQIPVSMSESSKKLRERAKTFLDGISNDLKMIGTLPTRDEVLVEYYKTLSAPQASLIVDERHKRMDDIAKQNAQGEAVRAAQDAARAKVDAVLNEPDNAPLIAPSVEHTNKPSLEKIYFASFKVSGTIEQLRCLKKFLEEGGFEYVQF